MSVAKIKKGDTVILCGFTGMKLGVYEVVAADAKKITIEKADGTKLSFDRKTGKQLNPKNPKYANFITEDDGSYVSPRQSAGAKKKATKKASTKKASKAAEDEEYEEEEETHKKPAKKKAPKKKAPEPEEKYEDDDEYEEVED